MTLRSRPLAHRVLRASLRVQAPSREAFVRRHCVSDAALAERLLRMLDLRERGGTFLRPPEVALRLADERRFEHAPGTEGSPVDGVPAAPQAGDRIASRYRLVRPLGAGGTSVVFLAQDELTGGDVAAKVMPLLRRSDADRWRREVAALRWLRLPGVVQLLDDGTDGQHSFVVMDFVEGPMFPGMATPAAWADLRRPLVALLEALARIHWAGVIHGDIKPRNVIVRDDGLPVVLDLGLSSGPELGAERGIAGTPRYIAPELLQGGVPSVASDLYAVGLMAYEAFTGELPHDEPSLSSLFEARTTRPAPALASADPTLPPAVARTVDALLAIDPTQRPASARAALAMLESTGTDEGAGEAPLPWLGATDAVDALEAAALEGRSLDLTGQRGSGRTRTLDVAARRLASTGRRILRVAAGHRPFESLRRALGEPAEGSIVRAADMRARLEHHLLAQLASGAIVIVDDAERVDRLSRGILESARAAGTIWRVFAAPRTGDVHVEALDERDLRALFRGPERLRHLPSDGAHELHRRTGGLPRSMAAELAAWERARLARREGDQWVITRPAIERLRAGLWVRAFTSTSEYGEPALDPALEDVMVAVDLAGSYATTELVAEVLERPLWLIQADVEELERRGLASSENHRLRLLCPSHGGSEWAEGRRVAVHRALADALPTTAPERVYHLLAAGEVREVGPAALAASNLGVTIPSVGEAMVVAEAGLRAASQLRDPALVGELLPLHLRRALGTGQAHALDRVLHQIQLAPRDTPALAHVDVLARAALLTVQGQGEHALQLLEALPEDVGPTLDPLAWSVRVSAARYADLDSERRTVEAAARWVVMHPDRGKHLALDDWVAWLRYREGKYAEAAALHERSAARVGDRLKSTSSRLSAASAWLEANEWKRAEEAAQIGRAEAAASRTAILEARGEWLVRCARYRAGTAQTPDVELVDATDALGAPYFAALIRLGEAAIAWRAGEPVVAAQLARQAGEAWRSMSQGPPAALAWALAAASSREPQDIVLAWELGREAMASAPPDVALQVAGLLAPAADESDETRLDVVLGRLHEIPERDHAACREVLSIQEAARAIRRRLHRDGG